MKRSPRDRYGVLPYRHVDDELLVALITRRRDPAQWCVPKGRLDEGCTPFESAVKEAYEEAGLLGPVGTEAIGAYEIADAGRRPQRIEIFLMHVTDELDDWPERGQRERCWLPADQAARLVPSDLAALVRGLRTRLAVEPPQLRWTQNLFLRAAA